ncbi:MAG: ArsI/CadI family heavy metal resistance metalloenzyme [Rickettsiales bacterium]
MTRLHIHVSVDDIEQSTKFYSALFGAKPSKQKSDYAKWMLEDPRINFAISARGAKAGLDHLGIQAENEAEMTALRERIKQADLSTFDDGETTCCYAKSDKTWVQDPSGIAWETYHTMGEAEFFNDAPAAEGACCVPKTGETKSSCC